MPCSVCPSRAFETWMASACCLCSDQASVHLCTVTALFGKCEHQMIPIWLWQSWNFQKNELPNEQSDICLDDDVMQHGIELCSFCQNSMSQFCCCMEIDDIRMPNVIALKDFVWVSEGCFAFWFALDIVTIVFWHVNRPVTFSEVNPWTFC